MVRKSGANIPQSMVQPPQLYQNAGENYARIRENAMRNFDAARQATSQVVQANAAATQADLVRIREAEDFRAAQAKADAYNKSQEGGGIVQGLAQLVQGVVGGVAAKQQLQAEKEAAEQKQAYEMYKDERDYRLRERNQELDENKFRYSIQKEYNEESNKLLQDEISTRVGEIELKIREATRSMSDKDGLSFAYSQFDKFEEEYAGLFKENPQLGIYYRGVRNKAIDSIWDENRNSWDETHKEEAANAAFGMRTKFTVALSSYTAQIPYLQSPEEAQSYTVDIINQAIELAQSDEAFMQIVKRNPSAWNTYMQGVTKDVLGSYEKYSTSNAAARSEASKISQFYNLFGGSDFTDSEVIRASQEWLAQNGMPQSIVYNPQSMPATNVAASKQKVDYLNNLERLAAAQRSRNPIFREGTEEHKAVFKVNSAQVLWDVLNNKQDRAYLESYYDSKIEEAKRTGSNDTTYWVGLKNRFKEWDSGYTKYVQLKQRRNEALQEYDRMVGKVNEPDTTIVKDALSTNDPARRVPVRGEPKTPAYSQTDIDKQLQIIKDFDTELNNLHTEWAHKGINLNDLTDRTYLRNIREQYRPYINKLNEELNRSGIRVDEEGFVVEYNENKPSSKEPVKSGVQPTSSRGSPLNFTGGNVEDEDIVSGLRGNPTTLPTGQVPLQNSLVPISGIGISPFLTGNPVIESVNNQKGITLSGGGEQVASLNGGEVVWSGQTTSMGNVLLVKNSQGLTEVFYGLKGLTKRKGDIVKSGEVVGTTYDGSFNMQLWASADPEASLWNGSGRNQQDLTQYFSNFNGVVELERGIGELDADDFTTHRPSSGAVMYIHPDYLISNGYIWNKRTGETRPLSATEQLEFPNVSAYTQEIQQEKVQQNKEKSEELDSRFRGNPSQASWIKNKPKPNPSNKYVFSAGHRNTRREGAKGEWEFTPHATRAIVEEGIRRGYDVTFLRPENTDGMSMESVVSTLAGYRKQGYNVFEIHGDSANDTGKSGVILGNINNYTEAEYNLAQEWGGYPYEMHQGKLTHRRYGVPILEVGSTLLFQDPDDYEEASRYLAKRFWDSIEGKNSSSEPARSTGTDDFKDLFKGQETPDFRPSSSSNTSRMMGSKTYTNGSYETIRADARANTRRVQNRNLTPQEAAALDTISYAEGTAGIDGYQTGFGYRNRFPNGWTGHPVPVRTNSDSTASGRYQFLYTTWTDIWGKNQVMTPEAQDAATIEEMKRHGAYKYLKEGDMKNFFRHAASSWVSIISDQSSDSKQGKLTVDKALVYYEERLKWYKEQGYGRNRASTSTNTRRSDGRTFENRPLQPMRTSSKLYTYRNITPNEDKNYGYRELSSNEYLRKSIYSASIKTGLPQQWLADIYMTNPNAFGNNVETFIVEKVKQYRTTGRINTIMEAKEALLGDKDVEDVGRDAGRKYDTQASLKWHNHPRQNCPICTQMNMNGGFQVHRYA